jgi:hypothetical protein
MKIVHKTLDNERIANCLAILRRDVGEGFTADLVTVYVDGGQVVFTYPSLVEGGYLTCGYDGTWDSRADDPWWQEPIKEESAALRAS